MAFKLKYRAVCDHSGCDKDIYVMARSHTEANQIIGVKGWRVTCVNSVNPDVCHHYCPEHSGRNDTSNPSKTHTN